MRPEAWVAQHTDTAVIAITNLNPTGGGANTTLLVGRIPTTPTPPAGDGPTSTFRSPARDVRVLIANAAGIPGIAGQLSQVLPDHYIVPTPTTATIDFSQPLTQTQVLYRRGFDQQAATLAEDLGATTAPPDRQRSPRSRGTSVRHTGPRRPSRNRPRGRMANHQLDPPGQPTLTARRVP